MVYMKKYSEVIDELLELTEKVFPIPRDTFKGNHAIFREKVDDEYHLRLHFWVEGRWSFWTDIPQLLEEWDKNGGSLETLLLDVKNDVYELSVNKLKEDEGH